MFQGSRRLLGLAAASFLAVGVGVVPAHAQDAKADELNARIERLERQNQELMNALKNLQTTVKTPGANPGPGLVPPPGGAPETSPPALKSEVQSIVKDYMADEAAKKKAEEDEKKQKLATEGYRIGTDMNVVGKFNEYGYLWLSTPNGDFTFHPGYWAQLDNVDWHQSQLLTQNQGARSGRAQGIASGAAQGGIGDLEDGEYFRRIRPFVEGTAWEVFEYRLIPALENDQVSTIGLDEFWFGINKIPLLGSIKIGHVKPVYGLEADMIGSSRTMTFMERSSYSEAIELNQNFVTGIRLNNAFFDQRVTYAAALWRNDLNNVTGAQFGDGQLGAGGRLTWLPIWNANGREFMHLGISSHWINGTNNTTTSPDRLFQLRARPELRDDDPAAGGNTAIPNTDSNRMVDTGSIAAENMYIGGLEFLYVRGPLTVQAEWGANWLQGAYAVAPTGLVGNPNLTSPQSYVFNGGYAQVAYTLTGENRQYDKSFGALSRNYFDGGPFTNFWLTRDENGRLNLGRGAWEIAARYSYVNLNDGAGINRIQGGVMNGLSLALTWYMNTNVSMNLNYVYDQRSAVPVGTVSGFTEGFGARMQISF